MSPASRPRAASVRLAADRHSRAESGVTFHGSSPLGEPELLAGSGHPRVVQRERGEAEIVSGSCDDVETVSGRGGDQIRARPLDRDLGRPVWLHDEQRGTTCLRTVAGCGCREGHEPGLDGVDGGLEQPVARPRQALPAA